MANPLSSLVDSFDTNTLDTIKWSPWGLNLKNVNKEIEVITTSTSSYSGMTSQNTFNLTGSSGYVQLIDAGNQSIVSYEIKFNLWLTSSSTNALFWYLNQGVLQAFKTVATTQTQLAAVAYDPLIHKYLRIMEASGTVYWDYSTDGSNWTTFVSALVSGLFAITSIYAEISVGTWTSEGSTTTAKLDNFNQRSTAITEVITKRYYYKIYDVNQKYITTWSTDVISDPQFQQIINGGSGQMIVDLARPYDNFGESVDVSLQNRVDCWVADADNVVNNSSIGTLWDYAKWDVDTWDGLVMSFVKIYSGYISAYSPVLDGEQQYIEITVLGYVTEASFRILKDGSGNTTVTYTSQDPGAIMKDVIDKYRADGGLNINYIGTSVQNTGTPVTYTFNDNTLKECFDKIVQLCPNGWYWFLDPNGTVFLQQSSLLANHVLTIGKDISKLQTNKRIENLGNVVYIIGGGSPNLFNQYTRATSVSTYGKFEIKIQDGQVIDNATADVIAKGYLDRNQSPETRTLIDIVDNNGENSDLGQNIEAFNIGDTIQIKNLNYGTKSTSVWNLAIWDTDVWDATLQFSTADVLTIQSIQYYPDYIEIEASNRLPDINRVIQTLKTTQDMLVQENIPTTPTIRSV